MTAEPPGTGGDELGRTSARIPETRLRAVGRNKDLYPFEQASSATHGKGQQTIGICGDIEGKEYDDGL
jgi:hypothetical protein